VKRSQGKGNFYHGEDQEGFLASAFDPELIGKEGTVSTELKPAGHILVDGHVYQALSETGFISKGSAVKIVGGKGSHLIVRGNF
jgi:membrane-bound serine protease (ClpP class)